MNEQDKNLIMEAVKMNRTEWRKIDSLVDKTTDKDVKMILRELQSSYQQLTEYRDLYFSKI
jgi:hypothetical protein